MAKILRRVFFVVLFLAVGLAGLLFWMAAGVQRPRVFEAPPDKLRGVETAARTSTATLRVVTWNVAWGYGFGSDGRGTVARPAERFERNLEKMAEVLRAVDADVVMLQEIDFDSARSHGVDQAARLGELAGLPWVARAESWRMNYLPFPYWPPKDHFGRILSGGAILSRFPVEENVVDLFPKPESNSAVYNLGYPFRYLQHVTLDMDGRPLDVFNAHLEAYDRTNREAHAGHVARVLEDGMQPHLLFGADLNAVPPESDAQDTFEDEPELSYANDATVARLREVPGLRFALTPERFEASEAEHFTFPAHAPNRRLDYLMVGDGFVVEEVRVLREAGEVSDHLPVFARLRVKDDRARARD